jgi:hypothetical protein
MSQPDDDSKHALLMDSVHRLLIGVAQAGEAQELSDYKTSNALLKQIRRINLEQEPGGHITDVVEDEEWETAIEEERELYVDQHEQAERSLSSLIHWDRQRAQVVAHSEAMVKRAKLWEEVELAYIDKRESFHKVGLMNYLGSLGRRSLKLIGGTLRLTKGRERVVIDDDEEFIDRHTGNEFVREVVTCSVDKRQLLAHIKQTGEIPNGCDLIRSKDSFKVDLAQIDAVRTIRTRSIRHPPVPNFQRRQDDTQRPD